MMNTGQAPEVPSDLTGQTAMQMRLALIWLKLVLGEDLLDDRTTGDPVWAMQETMARDAGCTIPVLAVQALLAGADDGADLVGFLQRGLDISLQAQLDEHRAECKDCTCELNGETMGLVGTQTLAAMMGFLTALRDANTRVLRALTVVLHGRPGCEVTVVDTTGKTREEVQAEVDTIKAQHGGDGGSVSLLPTTDDSGITMSVKREQPSPDEAKALAIGAMMDRMLKGNGGPLARRPAKPQKPEMH